MVATFELQELLAIPLGLVAGFLTTVAGLGGGLLLTVALAALVGPIPALALAAPALLLGNLHRIYLFRSHVDVRFVAPFVLGSVPGALLGAFLALAMPEWLVHAAIALALAFAIVKQLGGFEWKPSSGGLGVLSFVAGVATATSGGGGLILGPLLLSAGALGARFVASASVIASFMHIARVAGYGAGGAVSAKSLLISLAIGLCITAGNTAGKRVRLSKPAALRLTYGVLAICALATLVGVV